MPATARGDACRASPPPPHREDEHRRPVLEQQIKSQLIQHLVRQAPVGFVTGTFGVAAVLIVLWNAAPRSLLLGWLLSMALLSLPAFLVVWRFPRAPQVADTMACWRRVLIVAYGVAGAGWGAVSILLYPRVAMPYQLFLIFVLGAAGVGGMAALAPVRAVAISYLTATFVPMIGVLLAERSLESVGHGLLLLTFAAATVALAYRLRALLVGSVKLGFENLGLIDDLSRAKDEAETANRAKSVFLANVSHELRTPLALILGPTRRVLRSDACAKDETRRDLETVERNAQGLLKHVTDLLDVAKLEAGRMELDRAELDLVEVARRTTSLFEIVAKERDIELLLDTPNSLVMVGDAAKIERVLLNLVSNAMKFAPDGGRVRVALRREGGDVVLSVEDNGPGVPVPLRAEIFERFRKGDDSTTRRFGGTGLGLAIAKELVERHGGRIEVADGADGGAVFRVTLPLASDVTGAAPADAAARDALDEVARQTVAELRPQRKPRVEMHGGGSQGLVLVVEDNPEMSSFLAGCLVPDYRVAPAFDGREGLEKALELRPDVILVDVMLPLMGGDVLVRELRAHPELDGIPIIVLTAKADDDLRVTLLREGVQDFLTKPVSTEELCARVTNLVMLKRTRDVLQLALASQSRDVATLADQLAAANRAKDEFLAVLSHELRAPLSPVLSWAYLLREGRLDAPATKHAAQAIERNVHLQTRIVDDLLDVSRAITGKLRLSVEPVSLAQVVQAAIESVRPAADAKEIVIDATLDPEAGPVSGDPQRLQQVAWNLLSNAIKFTPRGGRVDVLVERVENRVRLTVRDNGIGIKAALVPRLFERFWQADSSRTRAQGGLGLGLSVVRHLIELHGGTVGAESEGEGRGATFTVTLPANDFVGARTVNDPGPSSRQSLRLRRLKVLVVDDERDACESVGVILQHAGAEVRTCLSASQALTAMDTWVPDILVSDIRMPGEDGYALIRKVRARKTEEGGGVAAVALTAYGRNEDRIEALSAGFQVHVGKPVEPDRLVDVVAGVIGQWPAVPH